MAAHDPETRSLIARIAAAERWGRTGSRTTRRELGQRGNAGLLARFEREADPDGTLTPEERDRAARSLYRAHMQRLALKSKTARARAREATDAADAADAELAALTANGGEAE